MSATIPLGIKNANPGNIRHGSPWNGLCAKQTDPKFCQFIDPKFGIRALAILLENYQEIHNLSTVREIINRWAPPADDNNTSAYVTDVSNRIGMSPDGALDMSSYETMRGMVCAIIAHECDNYVYPDEVIEDGISMAGIIVPNAGATS